MIPYPEISPIIFEIGPIKVRWYGLMYVLGFAASYLILSRLSKAQRLGLQGKTLQDLIFYLALGLILGARFGYILIYQFSDLGTYLSHPLEILAIWQGGMSFHGGLAGALIAGILFCRARRLRVLDVADLVALTAPIGLGLGRIGNFINGELYGRPTDVPWAMVFPNGGNIPRHPSQLYEAALEGLLLFLILWFTKDREIRSGGMVCLFFAGYGLLRFVAEFFREPDPQIGLFGGWVSMGQVLCAAMVLTAIGLWSFLRRYS